MKAGALSHPGSKRTPDDVKDERSAAHRPYLQLADELKDGAHARYNEILQLVTSFARAAEIANRR